MEGPLNNGTDGHGMRYAVRVQLRLKGGRLTSTDSTLTGSTEAVFVLAAETDFRDKISCKPLKIS